MNIPIPDGFRTFLQRKFGGTLRAPKQPNVCGHTADSSARLTGVLGHVSDRAIIEAVGEYYTSVGGTVSPERTLETSFGVSGKGFRLVVALSNFTKPNGSECSRILTVITVTER